MKYIVLETSTLKRNSGEEPADALPFNCMTCCALLQLRPLSRKYELVVVGEKCGCISLNLALYI